jgi:hypothetical protein
MLMSATSAQLLEEEGGTGVDENPAAGSWAGGSAATGTDEVDDGVSRAPQDEQ